MQLPKPTFVTPLESGQSEPTRVKTIAQLYEETSPIPPPIDECMVSTDEPMNYEEASREEAWKKAMIEEMQAIDRSNTWELVPPLINCRPIGLKWIFKLKRNFDGDVVRYKARLVVKDYSQKHGIDYDEVFSPVVRIKLICVLLDIDAQHCWLLHHLDVKSAFLNGDVQEELYFNQPDGFIVEGKEGHVLKLNKALYGLKQAPRAWYFKLHNCLVSLGFKRSTYEQEIYLKFSDRIHLIIGVYEDDLLVTGEKDSDISKFKEQMKHYFEMNNLGQLSSYLGSKVSQGGRITMSQRNYAKSILSFAKMEECNLAQTPLEARMKFSRQEGPLVDSTFFRSLIGSLRYLTHTRPNVTYSVGFLSMFMERPTVEHLTTLKRVLRYLRGTIGYGLVYLKGQSKARLVGYSDSDFAGDKQDRKSTEDKCSFSMIC